MADALRGSMDAAEYEHVVLGRIFLEYISDAFEERQAQLEREQAEGADPEDPDEYRAVSVLWVPREARWGHLRAQARQPTIGQIVVDAMAAIERDNSALKDVLPKDYARPALDKQRLGQLIDMISNIRVGDEDARSKDVIGRVYEYFLSQFASAEGNQNRADEASQVIEELIELARDMREANARGEQLGLSDDDLAFYEALETNDSAVQVLGDEALREIARELVDTVRRNVTIDWTLRENVRANLLRLVRRILRKHGYPPDKQERVTRTVLEQAEVLSGGWAASSGRNEIVILKSREQRIATTKSK